MLNAIFAEKGNTTIFEYTYGEAPATIIEPPLNIKTDEDESIQSSTDADVWIFFECIFDGAFMS